MNERESIRLSRRDFLKYIVSLLALETIAATTAYKNRHELRQFIKAYVASHFPNLYRIGAEIEEYGLQLIGEPVRVTYNLYNDQICPDIYNPPNDEVQKITNSQQAVDFFKNNPRTRLESTSYRLSDNQTVFQEFQLPDYILNNPYIRLVLGIDIETDRKEKLPNQAIALKCSFSPETKVIIAPVVTIPSQFVTNKANEIYKPGDYYALGLPNNLFSQMVISLGHDGSDKQVVPRAERMVIQGVDTKGDEFRNGTIALGTIYLWADGKNWGLAQWPNSRLENPNTGCVRMFWDLNPYSKKRVRTFNPNDIQYLSEQLAQQHGFINHSVTKTPYQHIGPTAIFRTDIASNTSDLVLIPPFLPFVAPYILKDILFETPVNDNPIKTPSDQLLIAIPDAKYCTMFGFSPQLLQGPENPRQAYSTNTESENGQNLAVSDFSQKNNSIGFYLGIN